MLIDYKLNVSQQFENYNKVNLFLDYAVVIDQIQEQLVVYKACHVKM